MPPVPRFEVLRRFWEQTPHSCERPSCLRALAAIRPGAMAAEQAESRRDCEEDALLFAVEHAPGGPELRCRIAELQEFPVESEELRAAAARRFAGGNH
ncbi:hypothetical protein [Kitasatospora griseola]|uniref:hypothetical protein n=1 Tax=Kitasatospora griseola TaxID=2064 RepID=UPI0037F3104F